MKRVTQDQWATYSNENTVRGNGVGDYIVEWKNRSGDIRALTIYPPMGTTQYYVDDDADPANLISGEEMRCILLALEKLCACYDMGCGEYAEEGIYFSVSHKWLQPIIEAGIKAGFRGRYVYFDCLLANHVLHGTTMEDRRHIAYHAFQLVRQVSEAPGRAQASIVYIDYSAETPAWHVFKIAKV